MVILGYYTLKTLYQPTPPPGNRYPTDRGSGFYVILFRHNMMTRNTKPYHAPTQNPVGTVTTYLINGISYSVLAVVTGWTFFALWYFEPWPDFIRTVTAIIWTCIAVAGMIMLAKTGSASIIFGGGLLMLGLWSFHRPSNDLTWSDDQAKLATAEFAENSVTLHNIRHAVYRSTTDYDIHWETKTYGLHRIRSVEFVVEPFSSWRGVAHTFLTFGFDDGEYVAISVEIRREIHASYSPFKGLFRQYEIMYVIGDERDIIALRTHFRQNPVYLFPIRATHEQVRALFVDMLQRANSLAEKPEFYNTLTNTCSSNIVRHFNKLRAKPLPFDWRVLFPGYADELARELGLIDAEGGMDALRRRFLVATCDAKDIDDPDWSANLRRGFSRRGEPSTKPRRPNSY